MEAAPRLNSGDGTVAGGGQAHAISDVSKRVNITDGKA